MPATAEFDTAAFIGAVIDLLENLSGIAEVYKGAPANVGPRVSAYVTVSFQEPDQKAPNGPHGGYWQRWCWALVVFCYRITDNAQVNAAEDQLASYLDSLTLAVYEDRTLSGVVQDVILDLRMSRESEYQMHLGAEYREFPLLIGGKQSHTFGVQE